MVLRVYRDRLFLGFPTVFTHVSDLTFCHAGCIGNGILFPVMAGTGKDGLF